MTERNDRGETLSEFFARIERDRSGDGAEITIEVIVAAIREGRGSISERPPTPPGYPEPNELCPEMLTEIESGGLPLWLAIPLILAFIVGVTLITAALGGRFDG